MLPTLGEVFGEPIPAYFAMLSVGFALATWLGARWAKRCGLDHEVIIDLGLLAVIAGVAGARILHVFADGYFWDYVHLCTDPSLVEWKLDPARCKAAEGVWDAAAAVCRPAGRDCFAWAAFWRGGLTYYGGLIAGIGGGMWFIHREGFPALKGADMAGMVIPLGLFWGRMGCFLGGCCFGLPHQGLFGTSFPPWSPASEAHARDGFLHSAGLPSLSVHPTQLYEAIGCLGIAALMMFVVRPRKRFDGEVGFAFLGSYALLRFLLEYLRADDRGALLGLSTSQLIGVLIAAATGFAWWWLRKRRAEEALNQAT